MINLGTDIIPVAAPLPKRFPPWRAQRAMTLVELAVAATIGLIVLLAGWATWVMAWDQTYEARATTAAAQNSFNIIQRIQQEVLRASVIEVPDPDNAGIPSMQVRIPSGGTTLRRAFRLSDSNLLIQMKDEGNTTFTAFKNITGLTFTVLDPPANAQVQILCTSAVNGHSSKMRTTATRRN